MLETSLIIVSCLLLATGAGCVALWRQRDALARRLESARQERENLAAARAEAERDLAVLKEKSEGDQRRLEDFREQIDKHFKALASDALKDSSEQFLKLAQRSFESEQERAGKQWEHNRAAIEATIKPVRETLDKYNATLGEVEKARKEAYGALQERLSQMAQDQLRLRDETANLTRALRRPEVRGRWGEIQLKRVVELAGMIDHCDFQEQVSVTGEGGAQRPDMVVNLPANRSIVIDAKTPLDAYLDAMECDTDEDRAAAMQRHARQIETKVRDLAGKQYAQHFERTPEFVVLFIPGEPFLAAAVQTKPGLIENAMERGVVIATPSTLISLLKAVAAGWREDQIAENARKIGDQAAELYARIAKMMDHFETLGASLRRTVDAYAKVTGSFERRVSPAARKLKELGVKADKEVPEQLPGVDDATVLPQIDVDDARLLEREDHATT